MRSAASVGSVAASVWVSVAWEEYSGTLILRPVFPCLLSRLPSSENCVTGAPDAQSGRMLRDGTSFEPRPVRAA